MMGKKLDGKRAKGRLRLGLALAGLLVLVLPALGAEAATVGRFVEVQGPVEVLKGGKPPAAPAKLNDGLEPGDVVRTKSTARAQIQFVDDSTITIAPGSRVAVEEFFFDASKGQRRAVLEVLRGLVKTVVTRLYRLDEPDFLMKTQTAVMGVRGTQWFTLCHYKGTDVFVKSVGDEAGPMKSRGLEVANVLAGVGGKSLLKARQYSRIEPGRGPGPIITLRLEVFDLLEKRLFPPGPADWDDLGLNLSMGRFTDTRNWAAAFDPLSQATDLLEGSALDKEGNLVRDTLSGLYVPPQNEPRRRINTGGDVIFPAAAGQGARGR